MSETFPQQIGQTICRTNAMFCGLEFWSKKKHKIANGDVIFWFRIPKKDGSEWKMGICGWCKDRIVERGCG